MKILVVAEEYVKLTRGVYRVWKEQCANSALDNSYHILLNREHWAAVELTAAQLKNVASLTRMPFYMPQSWALFCTQWLGNGLLGKSTRLVLRTFLNIIGAPFVVLWLAFWMRINRIDRLICHHGGWPAGWFVHWAIYAAKFVGIKKIILVVHSYPVPYSRLTAPLIQLEEWIIGRLVSDIVTVSFAAKDALSARKFRRNIRVIHNGIPIKANDDNYEQISQPKGLPVVGYLGALVHNKGVHVLLEAFMKLDFPCELQLVGPGNEFYINNLKEKGHRSKNTIRFLGPHEDVTPFLANFDLLVVPSVEYESFGIVILEAMLFKKPVICSDFGGMKEVVVHGETGLVVRSGDPRALADALSQLLHEPAKGHRMGNKGHVLLKHKFSASQMAAQYDLLLA